MHFLADSISLNGNIFEANLVNLVILDVSLFYLVGSVIKEKLEFRLQGLLTRFRRFRRREKETYSGVGPLASFLQKNKELCSSRSPLPTGLHSHRTTENLPKNSTPRSKETRRSLLSDRSDMVSAEMCLEVYKRFIDEVYNSRPKNKSSTTKRPRRRGVHWNVACRGNYYPLGYKPYASDAHQSRTPLRSGNESLFKSAKLHKGRPLRPLQRTPFPEAGGMYVSTGNLLRAWKFARACQYWHYADNRLTANNEIPQELLKPLEELKTRSRRRYRKHLDRGRILQYSSGTAHKST